MKRNAKEGKERHRIEDEMRLRFKQNNKERRRKKNQLT